MVWSGMAWLGKVSYRIIQYSMVPIDINTDTDKANFSYATSMLWYGTLCYGMVCCGMVGYRIIQYSNV